jgi:hypothetical protein
MAGPTLGDVYQTPGDDPRGRDEDDIEPPMTSIGLTEADQYIWKAGQDPPDLLDLNFPSFGLIKAREPQFRGQLARTVFQAGTTHTFAWWGPSRAFDVIGWQFDYIPMFKGVSLDTVNGPPPLFAALYRLLPGDGRETRHLPSRTELVFKFAVWPSTYPPSTDRMELLEDLARGVCTEGELRSLTHRNSFNGKAARQKVACCGCGLRQLVWG